MLLAGIQADCETGSPIKTFGKSHLRKVIRGPLDTRSLLRAHSKSAIENLQSLDHFIRPLDHAVRNCQINLFCRLQVDDKLKLRCLRYRQVTRFRSLEDLVYVVGSL